MTIYLACTGDIKMLHVMINLLSGNAAEPRFQHSNLFRSMNDTNGTCIAELSWNSPTNIRAMDISHYEIIFYGQILVANVTDDGNESIISAVYIYDEDCDCTNLNEFSVRAVNRCGRPGARSSTVLGSPKPLRTLGCDSINLITTPPPNAFICISKFVPQTYVYSYHDKLHVFYPDSFTDSEFYGVLAALIVMVGYSIIITVAMIIAKKEKQKPMVSESRALRSSYIAGMVILLESNNIF